MIKVQKTITIWSITLDVGVAISTSWPPLWMITDENQRRRYLPLAVDTTSDKDGPKLVAVYLGPLAVHLGWMSTNGR